MREIWRMYRPTPAALLGLAVVMTLRLAMQLVGDGMLAFPAATVAKDPLRIERDELRGKPAPKLLLLGSSRMRYGLREDVLAEALGLATEEVRNAGLSGGSPADVAMLLARNQQALRGAELVVIDAAPWMLNANRTNALLPATWRFSTLRQRLQLDRPRERVDALVDLAMRHKTERRELWDWLRGLLRLAAGQSTSSSWGKGGKPLWSTARSAQRRTDPGFRPAAAARDHMRNFAVSGRTRAAVEQILSMCEQARTKLVIVDTPALPSYLAQIRAMPGGTDGLRAYSTWLTELRAHPAVAAVLRYPDPGAAALSPQHFLDYGHLDKDGAGIFSRAVARDLRELLKTGRVDAPASAR